VLIQLQLAPSVISLAQILDRLQAKDDGDVFAFPVDTDEVRTNRFYAVAKVINYMKTAYTRQFGVVLRMSIELFHGM